MKIYSTLLIAVFMSNLLWASDFPIGKLELGEFHVGFQAFHEYDHRRTFRPEYDQNGNLQRHHRPRPMQVAVWYPTSEKRDVMQYRDYWYLNLTRENFFVADENDKQERERQYIDMWGMLGGLDKAKMKNNLSLNMAARLNATPTTGQFPLVILAQRENRGSFINFQLAEYLASHGYVVAVTPGKAKIDNSPEFNFWNQDGIQAGLADLQFVKGFMMDFPNVDKNKVAVVGYGFGSTTALAFAQDDTSISAIISLAGIIGTEDGTIKPTFETMNYFNDADRIQTPLLHIGVNNMRGNTERTFNYFDSVKFADVHYVKMNHVDEIAMGSTFVIDWLMSLAEEGSYQYSPEQAAVAYDTALQSTLTFLNYYTKEQRNTDPVSKLKKINQGEHSAYQFKRGKAPVPTQSFFLKAFRDNPENAEKVFLRFHQESPEKPIVSSRVLGNLANSLSQQGLLQRALVAYRIATIAFPDRAWAFTGLAKSYLGLQQNRQAKQAFDSALTLEIPQWLQPEVDALRSELGGYN